LREKLKTKREEMKAKIEAFKEQLRERMKERISKIKQKIVERIYERVNALNERITNHYLNVLDRLELILEKIESRTAKAKLHGKDVSQVESAINEAHEAIDIAREKIKQQAEKVYEPPEITTEENLRFDVGKLRKTLHDDLKAVEKLVKEARNLVHKAAVILAKIPRVNEFEVPTTTEEVATTTQETQTTTPTATQPVE
jgi:DNA repair exonuclease SbcCD ATPase subunit